MKAELAIVGGGPAGMASAVAAYEKGIKNILIIERDKKLGGILNQCIHHGFGLHAFKEELTGPEYALRYIEMITEREIPYLLKAMVLKITPADGKTPHLLEVMTDDQGLFAIEAKAVILAMGCRERPRGALNIPGYRPSGIYPAGMAQYFVNIKGYLPGQKVVILGSGDIGLIMARRMKLQGADVKMVVEILPYSGGLVRNIVQCLDDFEIPLKLSHTIIGIDGINRLKGVTVAQVDENLKPLLKTAEYIPCDTLLLSCGLIPENELSLSAGISIDEKTGGPVVNQRLETAVRGIFACGNVLHVHDLADNVSIEAAAAGEAAADDIITGVISDWGEAKRPKAAPKTRYTPRANLSLANQLVCIGCPASCVVTVEKEKDDSLTITGNACPVGEEYARKEVTAPARNITSLIRVIGGENNVVSVKTTDGIPKDKIFACLSEIGLTAVSAPVKAGDVLIENVAGTEVNIIATANC
ncbi:MAG: DUF1667 domain-containing protein [Lachnospiraceae bacterium]|nr:DUF1667 domain-containing protein [Lachnospiraceae bacterium]